MRGDAESIDSEGNVTPQSLGNYVIRAIMSLPSDERPKQRPVIKAEESGNVVLAPYPRLIPYYVIRAIMNLPSDERPKQRPVIKAEVFWHRISGVYNGAQKILGNSTISKKDD